MPFQTEREAYNAMFRLFIQDVRGEFSQEFRARLDEIMPPGWRAHVLREEGMPDHDVPGIMQALGAAINSDYGGLDTDEVIRRIRAPSCDNCLRHQSRRTRRRVRRS